MSPIFRQVTKANGDVELAPITIPQMETVVLDRKGKVIKRMPFRKHLWGRTFTGAVLDLPPSAHRHHWVLVPWIQSSKKFTGGMCTHCGDFMLKVGNGRCRGPGFP